MGILTRILAASLLLSLLACTSGCIVVRWQAETVLAITSDSPDQQTRHLGFRDAMWAHINGRPVIVARGWHQREHETYAFVLNEGYPAFHPRWIVLEPSDDATFWNMDIILSFDPHVLGDPNQWYRFRGRIPQVTARSGQSIYIRLRNVNLVSLDGQRTLHISGTIRAKHTSPQQLQRFVEKLHEVLGQP